MVNRSSEIHDPQVLGYKFISSVTAVANTEYLKISCFKVSKLHKTHSSFLFKTQSIILDILKF